jgi:tetratricopeptide (TPR) repeat protein
MSFEKNTQFFTNKGISLYNLKKFIEAIECFDEAIKINTSYYRAWCNKGIALGSLGQHDEAIECFDEASKINKTLK